MVSITQSKKLNRSMNSSLPDFGQVLGDGFRFFSKKWWLISLLFAAYILPLGLFDVIPILQNSFVFAIVALFIFVVSIIVTIIIVKLTQQLYQKRWDVSEIKTAVRKRFWNVLGTSLLVFVFFIAIFAVIILVLGILVILIYLLFQNSITTTVASEQLFFLVFVIISAVIGFVALVIFGTYWIFASYLPIVSSFSGLSAIKKSYELVKNRWWGVFGRLLVFYIIIALLALIIQYLFSLALLPLFGIFFVVVYLIQLAVVQISTAPVLIMISRLFIEIFDEDSSVLIAKKTKSVVKKPVKKSAKKTTKKSSKISKKSVKK